MTVSLATSWIFVVGGFAGLVCMELVLFRASRSQERNSAAPRVPTQDGAAEDRDVEA